jgi:lycopene beta-cyclase
VSDRIDYILVGGGLQNGLLSLAIRAQQPSARIVMIERGDAPGGNHTWCFHARDVGDQARSWIEPLVVRRWGGYDVAFPSLRRTVSSSYAMVTAERLAMLVTHALATPGSALHTRTTAVDVGPTDVTIRTTNGTLRTLHATAVIDARGPDHAADTHCGWQKFVGHEVVLGTAHDLTRPILMDATVLQRDGFRFMYVLPVSPTRLLVEDTYFSDRPYLDVGAVREEIGAYCASRGWSVRSRAREEVGVLPLPWRANPPIAQAPLRAGYAGGWFHPVTGYSFPIAARVASVIAAQTPAAFTGAALSALAGVHARQMKFAMRLNHMLFRWYPPDQRHHVLEQFYRRLPDATIARFYSLELTALDRARMMVAPPPRGLSIRAAFGGTLRGAP